MRGAISQKVLGVLLLLGVSAAGLWRVALPLWWSQTTQAVVPLDDEPVQEPLEPTEKVVVERAGRRFTIEKLFRYDISGEVLSSTAYDVAWTSDFFDVDVGLIWGPRREALKQHFTFQQMGRFLFWRSQTEPTPAEAAEVGQHISNNHLIPAEGHSHLARGIRWVSKGDRVRIRGALVRVLSESGEVLVKSSTTRGDSGDGACEVIWVDELQVNGRVFR